MSSVLRVFWSGGPPRFIGASEPKQVPSSVSEVLWITMSCHESRITDAVSGVRYNGRGVPFVELETPDMNLSRRLSDSVVWQHDSRTQFQVFLSVLSIADNSSVGSDVAKKRTYS